MWLMDELARKINTKVAELAVLIEMRNEKIVAARKDGVKLGALADAWDLTPQRIHAICDHFAKIEASMKEAQP